MLPSVLRFMSQNRIEYVLLAGARPDVSWRGLLFGTQHIWANKAVDRHKAKAVASHLPATAEEEQPPDAPAAPGPPPQWALARYPFMVPNPLKSLL